MGKKFKGNPPKQGLSRQQIPARLPARLAKIHSTLLMRISIQAFSVRLASTMHIPWPNFRARWLEKGEDSRGPCSNAHEQDYVNF